MNKRVFMDAGDIMDEHPPKIKIDNEFICIVEQDYWIYMDDLESIGDLIFWVHHITEKPWATRRIIRALIRQVCDYYGWKVYIPYYERVRKAEAKEWTK